MYGEPSTKKLRIVDRHRRGSNLIAKLQNERENTAKSIIEFTFNEKRMRSLRDAKSISNHCNGILYWMFRDCRVQDNWALLLAQKIAIKRHLPLHVCFCMLSTVFTATRRHFKFLEKGLTEVEKECRELNINFHLLYGEPNAVILRFVERYKIGAVVTDFFPLRLPLFWVNDLKSKLPQDIPMYQVDAHNIVPCWIASDKLEYSAATIRKKILSKLGDFLTEFPPVIKHPVLTAEIFEKHNETNETRQNIQTDQSVNEITWAEPGYEKGIEMLEDFLKNRLHKYGDKSRDPLANAVSNLSPWFHFGMISVQRCILEVDKNKCPNNIGISKYKESVGKFKEQTIIRRELSDNFCFYNEHYDSVKGTHEWAIKTLEKHRHDKRTYTYDLDQFENALTHDDLWNSCQKQMVITGKMHPYLRIYWAKKVLEWTASPEEALKWTIHLNDKYSIDGTDPNGYVGCMWSICGIHDHGYKEREVFGTIRYMTQNACKNKFDIHQFIAKWMNISCDGKRDNSRDNVQ